MIVKDESAVLERALNCAKQLADEIVIVDTGSKDNTKQIAQKFTDKVFDFVWQDDFSAARNFSFSKATCDYQMWLDADDVISEIERKSARRRHLYVQISHRQKFGTFLFSRAHFEAKKPLFVARLCA